MHGPRRARARLAADAEPVRRRHRHERQDDRDRVARARLRDGRDAGSRRRQRRHAARLARRLGRSRGDDRLRVLVVPARGLGRVRARGRGPAQLQPRPPRPPRHPRRLPRREAADLRRPAGRRRPRSSTPTSRPSRGIDLPGAATRRRYGIDGCAEGGCALRFEAGAIRDDEGVLIDGADVALAGEHNLRNAMAVAAAALAAGVAARRGRRRARAASPASRTGSSPSPRSTASPTSTTRRPRTSPPQTPR